MSDQLRVHAPGTKLIWLYAGLAVFGAGVSLVSALKAPFLLKGYSYFLILPFLLFPVIRHEVQKIRTAILENPDLFLPVSQWAMNAPVVVVAVGGIISVAAAVAALLSH